MTTKDVACPQCGHTQLDMVFANEAGEARLVCRQCGTSFRLAEEEALQADVGDVSEDDLARMTEMLPEDMLAEDDDEGGSQDKS